MTRTEKHEVAEDPFAGKLFDVEHGLSLYAYDSCVIPAVALYEQDVLAQIIDTIKLCHIYLIGYVPKIRIEDANKDDDKLFIRQTILDEECITEFEVPRESVLKQVNNAYYLEMSDGRRGFPTTDAIMLNLTGR